MDLFDNDVLGTSNVRITPDFPAVKKSWRSLRTWYIILPVVLMVLFLGFLFVQNQFLDGDILHSIPDRLVKMAFGNSEASEPVADAADAVEAYTVASAHTCADGDYDHVCDECGNILSSCEDANNDHVCDYGCGKEWTAHTDANKDHKCDVCGNKINSCADTNKDHKCDICGLAYKANECKDVKKIVNGQYVDGKDHKCDYGCDKVFGEHADSNKDHVCDYGCEEKIGEHVDINLDHHCDYGCLALCSPHVDDDKNHVCDYDGCEVTLSECFSANSSFIYVCDTCGEAVYPEWMAYVLWALPFILIEAICLIIWFAKKKRLARISIEFYKDIIIYRDGKKEVMRTFHGSYNVAVRQDTRRERRGNFGTVTIFCPGGPAMSMVFSRIHNPNGLASQLRAMKPKESVGIATILPESNI